MASWALTDTRSPRGNRIFALRDSVLIHAPIDRCFLLSTSIAIVHQELGMHAVAGRTQGLAQQGDIIRWEGWQLGLRHHHVSRIDHYHRPYFFQDCMVDGRFDLFEHDHRLRDTDQGTLLQDELRFSMHLGLIGQAIGRCILVPHILGLMRLRFAKLKGIAETHHWREYLADSEIPASHG